MSATMDYHKSIGRRKPGKPAGDFRRGAVVSYFRLEEKKAIEDIAQGLGLSSGETVRRGFLWWLKHRLSVEDKV